MLAVLRALLTVGTRTPVLRIELVGMAAAFDRGATVAVQRHAAPSNLRPRQEYL